MYFSQDCCQFMWMQHIIKIVRKLQQHIVNLRWMNSLLMSSYVTIILFNHLCVTDMDFGQSSATDWPVRELVQTD